MTDQSVNTRKKLVNAAIKIFAQKGFWKARVDDIVKEAGVAKGTFYLYFKSKSHCFRNILLLLHHETLSFISEKKSLIDAIHLFIERIYKYRDISKVFLFEAVSSGNDFQQLYFEFKSNLKSVFSKFIESEIRLSILSGFIREVIEQDIIFDNKPQNEIFFKIRNAIKIIQGE